MPASNPCTGSDHNRARSHSRRPGLRRIAKSAATRSRNGSPGSIPISFSSSGLTPPVNPLLNVQAYQGRQRAARLVATAPVGMTTTPDLPGPPRRSSPIDVQITGPSSRLCL